MVMWEGHAEQLTTWREERINKKGKIASTAMTTASIGIRPFFLSLRVEQEEDGEEGLH
jgi:hypothetical protein